HIVVAIASFVSTVSPPPPRSTLCPYTTLFRSNGGLRRICRAAGTAHCRRSGAFGFADGAGGTQDRDVTNKKTAHSAARGRFFAVDRKSTRLNSSHVKISYAVFCLKKKNDLVAG